MDNNKVMKMKPTKILTDTNARYETIASQEEVYLENTEEKLRSTLISENPSAYAQQETGCVDCCLLDGTRDELDHATEDLVTGDSDDPPLSQEDVAEIVRMTSNARGLEL